MNHKLIWLAVGLLVVMAGSVIFLYKPGCTTGSGCTDTTGLLLSAYAGTTPLNVQVLGPIQLVEKVRSQSGYPWNRITQCGFDIDWGDGTKNDGDGPEHDCAKYTTHIYSSSGAYTVTVTTWHVNGDDSRTTEWIGSAQVQVEGKEINNCGPGRDCGHTTLDITLQTGGDFEYTIYHLNQEGVLTYDHTQYGGSGASHATTTVSAKDTANLNAIIQSYDLRTLKNEQPPSYPPDSGTYSLTILADGMTYQFNNLLSSTNASTKLANVLDAFFFKLIPPQTTSSTRPCAPNEKCLPAVVQTPLNAATQPCGPTENCVTVSQAIVAASCAPSDAPALSISMQYDGESFGAQLYGNGLSMFEAGKPFYLDDTGTGHASICFGDVNCSAYKSGEVEIVNNRPFTKPNIPNRFNIVINGDVVPVEAHWDNTPVLCG